MRRISVWALSTLSAVVLLLGYHTSTSGPTSVTGTTAASGSFSSSASADSGTGSSTAGAGSGGGTDDEGGEDSTTDSSPSASPSASASASASPSGAATTVTGSVAETRWGPVQVQLTLTGTRITGASVLQYPQGNGRDIEINDQALPILTQETVQAQSASIDMVSGATVTSDGYLESLQSALDKAGL